VATLSDMLRPKPLLSFHASGSDGCRYEVAAIPLSFGGDTKQQGVGYILADGRALVQTSAGTFALKGGGLTFYIEP
jgi:hypothetical protein